MINIAVAGATGKMGQAIIHEIIRSTGLLLTVALTRYGSKYIGHDATLSEIHSVGVPVTDINTVSEFDIMLDFSSPSSMEEHLNLCINREKPILIGTTGLAPSQMGTIKDASEHIPIISSANTSIGVNLCAVLVETASRVLGNLVDIEIIDAHHRHKIDSPSGTALLLGESAAKARGEFFKKDKMVQRLQKIEIIEKRERSFGTIGFSSIRGGDIVGEHTVMFIGQNERLEITHRATDRTIFARGAVMASKWLFGKGKGLYTMKEVIGLDKYQH